VTAGWERLFGRFVWGGLLSELLARVTASRTPNRARFAVPRRHPVDPLPAITADRFECITVFFSRFRPRKRSRALAADPLFCFLLWDVV